MPSETYFNDSMTGNSTLVEELTTNELILLCIGLPIFIENSFAVYILCKCNKLIFQVKSLSLNLCLADCLTGLMLMTPKTVFEYLFSCRLKKYFNYVAVICSLFTATAINLDRVLSIYLNMRYTEMVTKRRLVATCFFVWIVPFPLSYAFFFAPSEPFGIDCNQRSNTSGHIVNLFARVFVHISIFLNIGLFSFMIRYIRKEARMTSRLTSEKEHMARHTSSTTQTLKKIILISGFLFVCVTPAHIVGQIHEFFPSSLLLLRLKHITEFLLLSNSFINPLLYVWRYYEVKYQVKRLLLLWSPEKLEKLDRHQKQYFASYDLSPNQNES